MSMESSLIRKKKISRMNMIRFIRISKIERKTSLELKRNRYFYNRIIIYINRNSGKTH